MKLSGVTKMVKRQLVCNVFHNIKSDDFYIGTASAIYCATGFPLPLNRSQMGALLGISEDTMIEKVVYNDFDCAYKSDLEGFNLDDTVKGEVEVKKKNVLCGKKRHESTSSRNVILAERVCGSNTARAGSYAGRNAYWRTGRA